MSDGKLDLSVPDSGSAKSKGKNGILVFLILVVAGLSAFNTCILLKGPKTTSESSDDKTAFLTSSQEREYALRLEEKGLYLNAARAWNNYINSDAESKKHAILYRIGDCYLKAGKYEQALDSFYRAEQIDTENELDISPKIQEALQAMGSYVAIEKDLSERTSVSKVAAGEVILAEAAGEIITENDLKQEIESQIDLQMAAMKGKVPMDQYNKQKVSVMSRYLDDPRMMQGILQAKVKSILLYNESRAKKYKETPAEQNLVENMRKELVGGRMLKDLVLENIKITETDIQTYFRANKDDYAEKPSVKVRVLSAADKASALKLYAEVTKNKSSFFGLSDSDPLNKNLDTWIPKGEPVPGIGTHQDLLKLYAPEIKKGDILSPVEINEKFYIFQAADKNEGRERSFDEAKEKAAQDLYRQKYSDTEKALLNNLMKKYKTVIHTEHFRKKDEALQK